MKKFLIGAAGSSLPARPWRRPRLRSRRRRAPRSRSRRPMAHSDREQTRDEVVAKVREHFAQLDANRDGFLTKAEADAGRTAMKAGSARSSASVAGSAWADRDPAAVFDRLDANNDGSISRDEFAKGREMRIERRGRAARTASGPLRARRAPTAAACKFRHMGGTMIGGRMFEHGRCQQRQPRLAAGSDRRRRSGISTWPTPIATAASRRKSAGRCTPDDRDAPRSPAG